MAGERVTKAEIATQYLELIEARLAEAERRELTDAQLCAEDWRTPGDLVDQIIATQTSRLVRISQSPGAWRNTREALRIVQSRKSLSRVDHGAKFTMIDLTEEDLLTPKSFFFLAAKAVPTELVCGQRFVFASDPRYPHFMFDTSVAGRGLSGHKGNEVAYYTDLEGKKHQVHITEVE